MDMKKADFTIVSRPDHIRFECPYCQEDVEVDWNDVDVPESWSDDWNYLTDCTVQTCLTMT